MQTHPGSVCRQQEVSKNNNNLLDLLALLIIGGIGMTISSFGIEANDPIVYGLGVGIMLVIFGCGFMKFITSIRDFIWDYKDRQKNKEETYKEPKSNIATKSDLAEPRDGFKAEVSKMRITVISLFIGFVVIMGTLMGVFTKMTIDLLK